MDMIDDFILIWLLIGLFTVALGGTRAFKGLTDEPEPWNVLGWIFFGPIYLIGFIINKTKKH